LIYIISAPLFLGGGIMTAFAKWTKKISIYSG
jgi:hypothetical protein